MTDDPTARVDAVLTEAEIAELRTRLLDAIDRLAGYSVPGNHIAAITAADAIGVACTTALARAARAEAALRQAVQWLADDMVQDVDGERVSIEAPEDIHVWQLCQRFGYGAVMDSASRQWRRKHPTGAFLVGTCAGIAYGRIEAARALAATDEGSGA